MKKIIILFSLSLLIILSIIVFNDQDEKVLSNNSLEQDLNNMIGVYLEDENGEYVSSSEIPSKDDGYEFSKAVCENDIEAKWNEDAWSLIAPNNKANFKCNLYFDAKKMAKETLLANYSTVLTRNTFNNIVASTTTGTIYKSLDESQYDNDGEVYYFAGNPTDNYVSFANLIWRIVRINGDGSIRLILNDAGSIFSFFNTYAVTAQDLGYMSSYNSPHGLEQSSSAKSTVDAWYQSNLINYGEFIDGNAGFCGDRTLVSGTGMGSGNSYYLVNNRMQSYTPTFKCENSEDLYTTSGSEKGNQALTYPIGLISADEVAYAGGVNGMDNTYYYLTSGYYWTMSPAYVNTPRAFMFCVDFCDIFLITGFAFIDLTI